MSRRYSMLKRLATLTVCACICLSSISYSYFKMDGPNDETLKKIEQINSTLEWRSGVIESEGLYYSDIRNILKSTNIEWDAYDDSMKSVDFILREEYSYNNRPTFRRIEARDLTIPPYSGDGPRLSKDEYKIATDFSKDYICKSLGDLVFDVSGDESDRIFYYQSLGKIQPDEMSNCIQRGKTVGWIYVGSEELKNILMSLPLFNKDKLELNESGYYSNYKMLSDNK